MIFLNLFSSSTFAFKMKPEATDLDGKVRSLQPKLLTKYFDEIAAFAIDHFTNPVHEQITHLIYGCSGDRYVCSSPENPSNFAPQAVIAGVRWNDNPPFKLESSNLKECLGKTIKLPNFSKCWITLFKDAQKRSKKGEFFDAKSGTVLLYRVHFGDMQFLHAMASRDGEEASETKKKIMMWSEFAYKVALGEIDRGIEIRKSGIDGMDITFGNKGWTAQQLFTRGDPTFRGEKDFRDLAFGTLLHIIHDSFVSSHVERNESSGSKCEKGNDNLKPGEILSFHSYSKQDHKKHGEEDSHDALELHLLTIQPNVVEVGKIVRSYYEAKRPWEELKDYLECVFDVEDLTVQAGPGEQFSSE